MKTLVVFMPIKMDIRQIQYIERGIFWFIGCYHLTSYGRHLKQASRLLVHYWRKAGGITIQEKDLIYRNHKQAYDWVTRSTGKLIHHGMSPREWLNGEDLSYTIIYIDLFTIVNLTIRLIIGIPLLATWLHLLATHSGLRPLVSGVAVHDWDGGWWHLQAILSRLQRHLVAPLQLCRLHYSQWSSHQLDAAILKYESD